jgi:multidrug efflux pump subunit AcrA (membrane-fusion protein)
MRRVFVGLLITAVIAAAVAGGYKLFDRHGNHASLTYTCPMHPEIIQDMPGSCPICGMSLVPVSQHGPEGEEAQTPEPSMEEDKIKGHLVAINVPPEKRRMLGVTFDVVSRRLISKQIKTSARVVADERRMHRITTKTGGWIEKLYINQTGYHVRKGDALLSIYSPELVSAQYEYLSAIKAEAAVRAGNDPIAGNIGIIKEAARERLKLFDLTEGQIKELEKSGLAGRQVTVYSPASGFVIEKSVLEGQKIMPNDSLLVIADMSQVWAEADIYEPDISYVKPGMAVELTLAAVPGAVFAGKVSFMYPYLDPATRTLKARMEIPNPDKLLRLEMYADAKITYVIGERISVSESAVMRTGGNNYVFVEGKGDSIEPRDITLGVMGSDGYFEVISGLSEGEKVVTSANFFIDSESSLKAAFKSATEKHSGH